MDQLIDEPLDDGAGQGGLWPFEDYAQQVERLRGAVGERIFLVEVELSAIQASAVLSDHGRELLAVIDFPRPDPGRRIFPHLLLLDDGRGLNLGRIARVSRNTPFAPEPHDLLFQERFLLDRMLFAESRLTRERIAENSKRLLAELLGRPVPPRLGNG